MSSIVLTGDTSGTITVSAPAVAGTRTLTLPAATGTVATTSGAVIQVVNLVYSTQSSMTVGTTDTAITGMNLNITPLGAGSKFRIDVRLFGEVAGAWETVFNIHRGAARINTTSNLNYHGLSMMTQSYGAASNDSTTPEIMHLATIDSTGSTVGTTLTYTLVASTNTARTLWINRSFSTPAGAAESGISEIIITEIGA